MRIKIWSKSHAVLFFVNALYDATETKMICYFHFFMDSVERKKEKQCPTLKCKDVVTPTGSKCPVCGEQTN